MSPLQEGVRERVAELLCAGAVSYADVAREVGVSRERVRQLKHTMHLLPSVRAITRREPTEHRCLDCGAVISAAGRCFRCAAYLRRRFEVPCSKCGVLVRPLARSYKANQIRRKIPLHCPDCLHKLRVANGRRLMTDNNTPTLPEAAPPALPASGNQPEGGPHRSPALSRR